MFVRRLTVILNISRACGAKLILTKLLFVAVNFAQIVPDGMLVFFPSYGALDTALQHWQVL